jgi:adenylate cyclase
VISERANTVYEFGPFRLEPKEHRLVCEGRPVPLTSKAFNTLRVLVERHGKLVSKQDLMQAVWPETTVEENNLDRNISVLRKILGEQTDGQSYIETVPRIGYRFVAPVANGAEEHQSASPEKSAPSSKMPQGADDISSIAVLPFADMSPEHDQDYLCLGLAEELINSLTRIEGLRVASRTSSFQFRDPGADIRAVGQHLGVGTVLEGSVRKADDRLRVTVQLIDVATGYHRWSQRFDRKLEDVLEIQDNIADNVATSLRGSVLSRGEKPSVLRPHTGAAAYEYYLRGRQSMPQMTKDGLEKSVEMFERAIALDANYGPAWGCMAVARSILYEWFGAKEEDLVKAGRASSRALEVAPNLAEAHLARGFTLSLSGKYDQAAEEFEEAIRLNPNLFEAHYYFARTVFANGDLARSVELFRAAAAIRPEDFQSPMLLGQSLRMMGKMDESREATREGIRRAERMLSQNPADGRALSLGSGALFEDGQRERAFEWCRRSLELYPDDMGALVNGACLHAKAGQKEEALELLERAFNRGWGKRDWIEQDSDYDILRDDPRFQRLLAKLK